MHYSNLINKAFAVTKPGSKKFSAILFTVMLEQKGIIVIKSELVLCALTLLLDIASRFVAI